MKKEKKKVKNNMKRVKVYSWLLMAVGLSLLIINLVNSGITGFVIGAASSSGNWQQSFFTLVLGMTFFFVGFFVLSMGKSRERTFLRGQLEKRLLEQLGEKFPKGTEEKKAFLNSYARNIEKKQRGLNKKKSAQKYTDPRDVKILSFLDPNQRESYVPFRQQLREDLEVLGGEASFYKKALEEGSAVYVHLTKKHRVKPIKKSGLKKAGPNTYSQAFIFTGNDALSNAQDFVGSLSNKRTYVGVKNPTNALIFKTPVVPKINSFSGNSPPKYNSNWKADFNHDVPRGLMYGLIDKRISA